MEQFLEIGMQQLGTRTLAVSRRELSGFLEEFVQLNIKPSQQRVFQQEFQCLICQIEGSGGR